jgi:hypothetical protein
MSDPSLRKEITGHTGSETATSGILRSLERFGGDSSIERYEITRKKSARLPTAKSVSWNVRAVRSSETRPGFDRR